MDLVGHTYGRLRVVSHSRTVYIVRGNLTRGYAYWNCICTCGTTLEVNGNNMRHGHSRSCGCLNIDEIRRRSTTHGSTETVEYEIWTGILTRCRNQRCRAFRVYGGAGVTVCERWLDFTQFYSDMGPRPSPEHSIDRIDNKGNYEPGNCRWATRIEQANNRRDNVRVQHGSAIHTLKEWSRITTIPYSALHYRHKAGWGIDRMLTEQPRRRGSL
jgi:hypothetical protein